MDSHEPIVDSGLIQVSLGLTGAGFLIEQFGGSRAYLESLGAVNLGMAALIMSSISTVVLYFVYFMEWVHRRRHQGYRGVVEDDFDGDLLSLRPYLFWAAFLAQMLLMGTLFSILSWAISVASGSCIGYECPQLRR